MTPARLSIFIIITQSLLNHVVTADLQISRIECMRNLEPHCCEAQCGWQQENITEEGDCEVQGNYMKCEFEKGPRNLTTPSKLQKIASAARCKIHKKKRNYTMSCHHEDKPICCDTPCECGLNLLKATCTMQEKSMECSCAGSGSGDNPVLNFRFKNSCLHKTNKRGCDFMAGDTCYISTGVTDGKGQEQKRKQVSDEDKKEMQDNNPANNNEGQPYVLWICISGICGIFLGIICCYFAQKYSICSSCCENQKRLDPKRKTSSSEDKVKESETTDDEGQDEMKQEEPCLQQHKKLDRVQYVRQRFSSTSGSESEPSCSIKM